MLHASGLPPNVYSNVIALELGQMLNAGNFPFRVAEVAQVLDARSSAPATSAQVEVVAIAPRGMLVTREMEDGGLLHTYPLTGADATHAYRGTLVTDYALANNSTHVFEPTDLCACSPVKPSLQSESHDFNVSAEGGLCVVRMHRIQHVDTSRPLGALRATTCVDGLPIGQSGHEQHVEFRMIDLPGLEIQVEDMVLNRLAVFEGGSEDCEGDEEFVYQRTRLHVLSRGLDVTSLATRLYVADATIAQLVRHYPDVVQGMTQGSTHICTHNLSYVCTPPIQVSDITVTTELRAKVITDVTWVSRPSLSYSFPAHFQTTIELKQKLTQRPVGVEFAGDTPQ